MNPVLFHVWGPFAIHAYGVCIAVGALIAIFLLTCDQKLSKIATQDQLMTTLQLIIVSGYVGGRLGFLISESEPLQNYIMLFKFWEPGLSILGGIIGAVVALSAYLFWYKIPVLPFLDRIALYTPLVQSFGRVGCFFAGCCFGVATSGWWGVMYTHAGHMAPLNVLLHPSQLYSAVILFVIFLLQYFYLQKICKTAGVLLCSYLILVGFERFLIDFVRWDRLFFDHQYFSYFSIHQSIAVMMMIGAIFGLIFLKK
ncbi:prolipoprotein diacylglyceryl transferase [Candidatus Babeliales bacterium]|nr:prolipoprotein diacylglyceryl transferase [Candidatus Babeliales bacterium]